MMFLNKKGIALILVISSISMLAIMMVELTFGSQLNFRIAKNFQNAAKARALAQSGVYFALIELKVSKNIKDNPAVKQIPGFSEGFVDKIWQFGFLYPPIASTKSTFGSQKAITELVETSKIDGKITAQIFDESSKINLNDLAQIQNRAAISQQLEMIFEDKKKSDEEFFQKYRDLSIKSLINNIVDWIDKDRDRIEGGDENNYYDRLKKPYKSKNAPFDTISELGLIEGFENDDILDLFLPYITVYQTVGINVNSANAELLRTISPELTPEDTTQIIEKRETEGYFKSTQEFEDFCKNTLLKSAGFNTDPKVKLAITSSIYSIESMAEVGGTTQTIKAFVDVSKSPPVITYWNIN